ncbi:hypothetical protein LJR084_001892 [Variovorax sp. LjRoot84]|uniref:hypothetical protein n=1 Tax=Variovorax sp. LjRoot84 TaxID=3342340 RepID=UPI003ED01134
MNCKPNDICVVVGEVPGCECNIGAQVRVTRRIPFGGADAWEFEEASRPLKMIPDDGRPLVEWVRGSSEGIPRGRLYGFYDRHLLPIRAPGDDAIDWASRRTPRSVDLQADQFARARAQLQEAQS